MGYDMIQKNFAGIRTVRQARLSLSMVLASIFFIAIGIDYAWQSRSFQSLLTTVLNQKLSFESTFGAHFFACHRTSMSPQIEPILISEIPFYEEGAVRLAILPTPLRRVEFLSLNEDDGATDESLVIMDKVVVLPKIAPIIDPVRSKLAVQEHIKE